MSNSKIISEKDITKGALNLVLGNPLFLIPFIATFPLFFLYFIYEYNLFLLAAFFSLIFFLTSFVLNTFVLFDRFKNKFIKEINLNLQQENKDKILKIKRSLKNEKAINQIELFQKKHNRFEVVLNEQLSSSSLAYQRLIGGFDQINLIAFNNIEKILNYEENMNAIDDVYITNECERINKQEMKNENDLEELESLGKRLELKNSYKQKISTILSDNEKALTNMDLTLASVVELKKPENMKEVLSELQTLANVLDKRTSQY